MSRVRSVAVVLTAVLPMGLGVIPATAQTPVDDVVHDLQDCEPDMGIPSLSDYEVTGRVEFPVARSRPSASRCASIGTSRFSRTPAACTRTPRRAGRRGRSPACLGSEQRP